MGHVVPVILLPECYFSMVILENGIKNDVSKTTGSPGDRDHRPPTINYS